MPKVAVPAVVQRVESPEEALDRRFREGFQRQSQELQASLAARESAWAQDERNREFKQMVGAGWQRAEQRRRADIVAQATRELQQQRETLEQQVQDPTDTFAAQQLQDVKDKLSLSEQVYQNLMQNKDIMTGIGPDTSASSLRFLSKFAKLLEKPGEAVGGILKTLLERAVGYELVAPEAVKDTYGLSVQHGLRIAASSKPADVAAKSLGETLLRGVKRVGEAVAKRLPETSWTESVGSKIVPVAKVAGKWVAGKLTLAAELMVIKEGVENLARMGVQYKATVDNNEEAQYQTGAMQRALQQADILTRRLAADISQFPEDIRNLERERGRLDYRIKNEAWLAEQLEIKRQEFSRERESAWFPSAKAVGGLSPQEVRRLYDLNKARDTNLVEMQRINKALTEREAAFHVAKVAAEETAKIKQAVVDLHDPYLQRWR